MSFLLFAVFHTQKLICHVSVLLHIHMTTITIISLLSKEGIFLKVKFYVRLKLNDDKHRGIFSDSQYQKSSMISLHWIVLSFPFLGAFWFQTYFIEK